MKTALRRICAYPGCQETYEVEHGNSVRNERHYCDEHREQDRSHGQHRNPTVQARRQAIYNSKQWKLTKRIVRERDNFTCVLCEATDYEMPLVVDHIGGIDYDDPFNASKCRLLCLRCSGRVDGARGYKPRQQNQ